MLISMAALFTFLGLAFTLVVAVLISYHLRRFSMPADKHAPAVNHLYRIGAAVLGTINLLLLVKLMI